MGKYSNKFFRQNLFLALTVGLAQATQVIRPTNDELVNSLKKSYSIIDKVDIENFQQQVEIVEDQTAKVKWPNDKPECGTFGVKVKGQIASPFVIWEICNKIYKGLDQQEREQNKKWQLLVRFGQKAHNNRIVDSSQLTDPQYKEKINLACSKAEEVSSWYKQHKETCECVWKAFLKDWVKKGNSAAEKTNQTTKASLEELCPGDPPSGVIGVTKTEPRQLLSVKVSTYEHNQPSRIKNNSKTGPYSKYIKSEKQEYVRSSAQMAIYCVSDLHGAEQENIMYNINYQARRTTAKEVIVMLNGDYPKYGLTEEDRTNLRQLFNRTQIETRKNHKTEGFQQVPLYFLVNLGNHDTGNWEHLIKLFETIKGYNHVFLVNNIMNGVNSTDNSYLTAFGPRAQKDQITNNSKLTNMVVSGNLGFYGINQWQTVGGFGKHMTDALTEGYWNPYYAALSARRESSLNYRAKNDNRKTLQKMKFMINKKDNPAYKEGYDNRFTEAKTEGFNKEDTRVQDGVLNKVSETQWRAFEKLNRKVSEQVNSLKYGKCLKYLFVMNHGDAPNLLYEWKGVSAEIDTKYRCEPGSWNDWIVILLNGHLHDGFSKDQFKNYQMGYEQNGPVFTGKIDITNRQGGNEQVQFYSIDIHSQGLRGNSEAKDQIVEILMG